MHVLVATDGCSDVAATARFAHALAGAEGSTTVATVVHVPRQLVTQLREKWGEPMPVTVDADAEYVGTPDATGTLERSFPGDDAVVEQYLGNKRVEYCRPIASAIRDLGGNAESMAKEGTEISKEIMNVAADIDADVIVIGSHGLGAFHGLLGSTGSKLVRRAKRPVLVLR